MAPDHIRRVLYSGASNMTAEDGTDLEALNLLQDLGDMDLANDRTDIDRISKLAAEAIRNGPAIFMGGDHSVTFPILAVLATKFTQPVNLIHFDAHPDLYDDFQGNPYSHASPFARIMERQLASNLLQIGVRTVNAHQKSQMERFSVKSFGPGQLDAAIAAMGRGPTYVSIDLDVLDPAFAPGVSHHEPGGLSTRELIALVQKIPGPILSADIVEYNPSRDSHEVTAAVAAKLIKELAAKIVSANR